MSGSYYAKAEGLTQLLRNESAAFIVVVDARGLTVEQDTVLRRAFCGSEVEYKVIKNSILRRS